MNILFYIEPKIERNDPYFRLATIRNSLIPQIEAAKTAGHRTLLVFGRHLLHRLINEGLESKLGDYATISDAELSQVAPHHRTLATKGTHDDFSPDERAALNRIIHGAMPSGFNPDLIVVWESPAEFLRTAFPETKLVYELPGPFSRAPYPDYTLLLPKLLSDVMRPPKSFEGSFDDLRKNLMRSAMIKPGVIRRIRSWRKEFSHLILYPLQIDDYFMVDEVISNYGNQFGALEYILLHLPKDFGLIATLYKSRSVSTDTMTDGNKRYLRDTYHNFILDDDLNSYDNVSQALMPLVDGAIVASSSVGFQAALWQKPLLTLGPSHLQAMATADTLESLITQVRSRSDFNRDAPLAQCVSTYALPTASIKTKPVEYIQKLNDVAEIDLSRGKKINIGQIAQTLLTSLRPEPVKKGPKQIPAEDIPFKGIREVAQRRQVVSFDIFDTLLVRPLASPVDLFRMMEKFVQAVIGRRHCDFTSVRRSAEREAFKKAIAGGRGEILIDDIYREIQDALGISADMAAKIMAEELKLEARLLYPRKHIAGIYHEMIADGKDVHLISDMYLPEEMLGSILKANGITGFKSLFLSSTHNAKKQSGALFEVYKARVSQPVETMLHIGDNEIGDFKRPKELGIAAAHINRPWDTFKESWLYKRVWARDEDSHSLSLRCMLAVIANECYDDRETSKLNYLFPRGRHDLGFAGFGPLLLSYSNWILSRAKKDGIKRLFFLSRDGLVMKMAYDIVAKYDPAAPESVYLHCSRRSANVAKLRDFDDILDLLMVDVSKMSIERLVEVRFGLSPIMVQQNGVHPEYERLRHERVDNETRGKAIPVLRELETLILSNARDERRDYTGYLESVGFTDAVPKAIVDIGYAGTMQESLYELTERKHPISGLYLVTFRPALERCEVKGLPTAGYLGNFIDRHDTHLPFCRHIPAYESLFSNDEQSLLRVRSTLDKRFIPVFQPESPGEAERRVFARQVHQGALAFVETFCSVFGELQFRFDFEPMKALRVLREYFAKPTAEDAALMVGVVFEDNYGGGADKVIIRPTAESSIRSNWVQGDEALYSRPAGKHEEIPPPSLPIASSAMLLPMGWRKIFRRPIRPAVKMLGTTKNLAKFDAHPAKFFAELQPLRYRIIGRLLFGRPKYRKGEPR